MLATQTSIKLIFQIVFFIFCDHRSMINHWISDWNSFALRNRVHDKQVQFTSKELKLLADLRTLKAHVHSIHLPHKPVINQLTTFRT